MIIDANDAHFQEVMKNYPSLSAYSKPMKKMERPLIGREKEMRSLKATFARAELSNAILLAEAGSGKALDDATPIAVYDERGYVPISELAIGDKVFDDTGNPVMVMGVFPQEGELDAYKVTFADGSTLICNDEHYFRVRSFRAHFAENDEVWARLSCKEMLECGLVDPASNTYMWWTPVAESLRRDTYHNAIRTDALAYGCAVSDSLTAGTEYPLSEEDMKAFLYADEEVRRRFLTGLISKLDCKVSATGSFCLECTNDELAEQIVMLYTSIGKRIWMSRSSRGAIELTVHEDDYDLAITSIEPLGEKRTMTCITVESPHHTYVAGYHHVVTHNTALVQGAMETDSKRIYMEVDLTRMVSDAKTPDEVADMLKKLFAEASDFSQHETHEIVLFMDEFHQIVQISPVAVEALKPLLADSGTRGIRVVAATTYDEFMQHISANQPLVERLQRINLPEVDRDTTCAILAGMAKRYGVDEACDSSLYSLIYEYTQRYIPANAQPRKSILMFDSMIGWHRSEGRPFDMKLLADVIYESVGVNVAFSVDAMNIKKRIDEKVYAQDFATRAVANRLQLCVADLNDKTRPQSVFLFCGASGVGKGTAGQTPIPVMPTEENGYVCTKLSRDIEVGDYVFSRRGTPERVVGVFPQGMKDVYRVTLADGRSLVVDGSHLWGVFPADGRKDEGMTVLSTETLLKRGVATDGGAFKYVVPMNRPVHWPEAKLECDPYVLGISFSFFGSADDPFSLAFSNPEVAEQVAQRIGAGSFEGGEDDYITFRPKGTKGQGERIKAVDVLPSEFIDTWYSERRIPEQYLHGSLSQRNALMRGLFDNNGVIDHRDDGRFSVSYVAPSEGFAQDIQELMWSLGMSSTVDVCGTQYNVHVNVPSCLKNGVFTTSTKRWAAEHTEVDETIDYGYVAITSIEKLPEQDETFCLYVDDDEHLYQAGQYVVTHNTEVTKQMADILFGDAQRHLIRFDCSEFANDDSLERFRSELTTRVWERPYSIVLLDEIEKASPVITRLLLSVFDDARLTDVNGRTVAFNNAYIVLTTNAGSEIYQELAKYESSDTGSGEILQRYEKLIRRSLIQTTGGNKFPPELLGRVDVIVPFQPLSTETMLKIAASSLSKLKMELWRKHHVELGAEKRVLDYLVRDSMNTDTINGGARGVKSMVESEISTAVAAYINEHPETEKIGVTVAGEMAIENEYRAQSDAYIKIVPLAS